MGYRGKLREQQQARDLRAQAWTMQEIADHLGVSKSSVSLWVRDVEFEPKPRRSRRYGARQRPPPVKGPSAMATCTSPTATRA
jgi:transposase